MYTNFIVINIIIKYIYLYTYMIVLVFINIIINIKNILQYNFILCYTTLPCKLFDLNICVY